MMQTEYYSSSQDERVLKVDLHSYSIGEIIWNSLKAVKYKATIFNDRIFQNISVKTKRIKSTSS